MFPLTVRSLLIIDRPAKNMNPVPRAYPKNKAPRVVTGALRQGGRETKISNSQGGNRENGFLLDYLPGAVGLAERQGHEYSDNQDTQQPQCPPVSLLLGLRMIHHSPRHCRLLLFFHFANAMPAT
jgi:hypothetical protein